jgi:hypothetical protein
MNDDDDDIFNPALDEDKLENDYDTPAAPAQDETGSLSPDSPLTDSRLDEDELYSEGLAEAAGLDDNEIGPDDSPKPLDPEE